MRVLLGNARVFPPLEKEDQEQILHIRCTVREVGAAVCALLIGLHAFTGCNSTSAFHGKGKAIFLSSCKGEPITFNGIEEVRSVVQYRY